jgi:hypothetical protein
MKLAILYLNNLNISSVEKTYSKTIKQLQEGDFKSADVRKMAGTGYYRQGLIFATGCFLPLQATKAKSTCSF